VDISKDKKNKYEEIKIGGTIESSDDDDENPFIKNSNKNAIGNQIRSNVNPLRKT
jgi:hypothetical protein